MVMSTQASNLLLLLLYIVPTLLIVILYLFNKKEQERRNQYIKHEEFSAGLTEPASLHPAFDHSRCLGCGSCVMACHEKNVLGLINGKAELISPTNCIGDGACKKACPIDSITLVFGTERRGVDIPVVKPNYETNVPGIFVAGELGGMGLISNAIEQGRQALESIRQLISGGEKEAGIYDVIIIGSGPAGFSATLAAKEDRLNYLTLEQETLGGAVAHYPKGKIVMTSPAVLPIVGKTKFTETTKEKLLDFWKDAERRSGVNINYGERVTNINCEDSVLEVTTQKGTYKTQTVLLAIGRRGTPRKLGVPGEEKPKVVYEMIDPEQFQQQHVLIVGGGNSALEAAVSLIEVSGTTVTLSYRKNAFNRAKPKNRELVQLAQKEDRLNVILNSQVKEIRDIDVVLEQEGEVLTLKNDSVIICAGGILPTGFLEETGIESKTMYGEPLAV
jgi:thioredoxin reductase